MAFARTNLSPHQGEAPEVCRVLCDCCLRDITALPFIRCAECAWDQCLGCYLQESAAQCAMRTMMEPLVPDRPLHTRTGEDAAVPDTSYATRVHSPLHNFRLVQTLTAPSPLCAPDWRILDDLQLLGSLVVSGIGNFAGIAEALQPFGEAAVRKRFYQLAGIAEPQSNAEAPPAMPPSSDSALKSDPNDPVLLGYMPLRGDFESELINHYESYIDEMKSRSELRSAPAQEEQAGGTAQPSSNSPDAAPEQTPGRSQSTTHGRPALETYMLEHYRAVIKERAIWRSTLIKRGLVEVNAIQRMNETPLGTLAQKWRWLVPLISKNDFNALMDGLLRADQLRMQLEQRQAALWPNEEALRSYSSLLSSSEHELCRCLRMSQRLYVRLKRLAVECFVQGRPLEPVLARLFADTERRRVAVLLRWFKKHGMAVAADDGASGREQEEEGHGDSHLDAEMNAAAQDTPAPAKDSKIEESELIPLESENDRDCGR